MQAASKPFNSSSVQQKNNAVHQRHRNAAAAASSSIFVSQGVAATKKLDHGQVNEDMKNE